MRSRVQGIGSRLHENAVALAGAGLCIAVLCWLGLSSWAWTDYDSEARPAFDALVSGHLLGFLKLVPAYGGSMLLRAPFVLVPKLWGGGELSTFRAAAAPGLAASAILGVWLVARLRDLERAKWVRAIALFLCVANPITLPALEYGHPEELLGAVLCVAAVLVAMRNRPIWAGVLLGLAIANKQWALLAAGPVLIALPKHRLRALMTAGGVATALLAPLMLLGSNGLASPMNGASTGTIFNPWQLWWFFGSHSHLVRDTAGHVRAGYRVPPSWIGSVAHPLIVALVVPLTMICALRRRDRGRLPRHEALLLLMLVLLLRFALDPWNISYYSLPFLVALVVWETLRFDRPPVLALFASGAAWFVSEWGTALGRLPADDRALIFIALVVPAIVAILTALYAPGLGAWLSARIRRRPALLSRAPGGAELA